MKFSVRPEISNLVLTDKIVVLTYFKSKLPLFHNSNVFFRDLQFIILSYLETKGFTIGYTEAELLTRQFVAALEKDGILLRVNAIGWRLNYPAFVTGNPIQHQVA